MAEKVITDFDLTWENPYAFWNVWGKIGFALTMSLPTFVGGILFAGIISFETYGMDPQKRSLTNQLTSQAAAQIYFMLVVRAPFLIWKGTAGWTSGNAFWIYWFLLHTFAFQATITYSIAVWFRYFTIVIAKRMLPIEDNFVARFILLLSILIGSWMAMVMCFCNISFIVSIRFFGLNLDDFLVSPVTFNIPVISTSFSLFTLVFITVSIQIEARKGQPPPAQCQQTGSSNNVSSLNNLIYNSDVVKLAGLVIIGFLASVCIIMIAIRSWPTSGRWMLTLLVLKDDLLPPFIFLIVIPIGVYARNSDLRRHVSNLIRIN